MPHIMQWYTRTAFGKRVNKLAWEVDVVVTRGCRSNRDPAIAAGVCNELS